MLNIISSEPMERADYAEMQILSELPLGAAAEEEETLPAESSAPQRVSVENGNTSTLDGRGFFICQGNGWSDVEAPPASPPNVNETLGRKTWRVCLGRAASEKK